MLPVNTPDPEGPYRVQARITDDDGVNAAVLTYRIGGGDFQTVALRRESGDLFVADIPGQVRGTAVEYRLMARDGEGNETFLPSQESSPLRFEVLTLSGEPVLYVALRWSNLLSVIDTGPGVEVARIPTGGETPLSVIITPDERYVFVANTGSEGGGSDNRVRVVETATHRVAATIGVGTAPLDLAVAPDGRRVYVTNSKGQSVSVLDVAGLREIRRLPVVTAGEGPYGIAVSSTGRQLYVTDIEANQVLVLDAEDGRLLKRIDVVASPRSLALSAGGGRLYAAGFDGGLSVVDTKAGAVVQTIDTSPTRGGFRVALSPDGKRAYVTDWIDANLLVVDLGRNDPPARFPVLSWGRNTRDLAVSPDGRRVYVSNQDSNDLLIFDTISFRVVKALKVGDGPRGIAVRTRMLDRPSGIGGAVQADFNGSGRVDFADFLLFAGVFGTSSADEAFDAQFDLDRDGRVTFADFLLFAGVFGEVRSL